MFYNRMQTPVCLLIILLIFKYPKGKFMDLRQFTKNRMYKNVLGFLNANAAAWSAFERLVTQIALFARLNTTLDGFISQQAQTSKGYTGNKNSIMAALIANTVNTARKALVYAVDQNNDVLTALFSVQASDLSLLPQNAALANIENIYDGLRPIAAALVAYNVSDEDIALINRGITAFKAAQPGTGNARAIRKAGTEGIKTTMASIDGCLRLMDNLIIHGIDNAELVNEYRNNRKLDPVGMRHTGIIATIDNSVTGDAINDAKMEIAALHKTAASNLRGVAEIIKMKPGLYEVVFSATGFAPQTLILKIDRGVKLEVNVNLVQAVQEMGIVKAA